MRNARQAHRSCPRLPACPGRRPAARPDFRQEQSPVRAARLVGARDRRTSELHFYAEEESLARHLAALRRDRCASSSTAVPACSPSARSRSCSIRRTICSSRPTRRPGLDLRRHRRAHRADQGPRAAAAQRVVAPPGWVTRHELAHAYMLEKLARVMRDHRRTQDTCRRCGSSRAWPSSAAPRGTRTPRACCATRCSSGEALPLTRSDAITGTVLMYKEGQSFLLYLAERFGPDKVFDLMDNWHRADDFETVVPHSPSARRSRSVDEDWFESMRRRYYPTVATCRPPPSMARRLTPHGPYNLGPRVLPARARRRHRWCASATSRRSESGVDLMLSEPGKKGRRRERRLLRGGQSPSFESFHLFQNRPDASPTGTDRAVRQARRPRRALPGGFRRAPGAAAARVPAPGGDPRSGIVPGDHGGGVLGAGLRRPQRPLSRDAGRPSEIAARAAHQRRLRRSRARRLARRPLGGVRLRPRRSRGRLLALSASSLSGGAPERVSEPRRGRRPAAGATRRMAAGSRSARRAAARATCACARPSRRARRGASRGWSVRPTTPTGSPDGKGLLFTAQEEVEFQTYVIRFDPDTLDVELDGSIESVAEPACATSRPWCRRSQTWPSTPAPAGPTSAVSASTWSRTRSRSIPALGAAGGGQIAHQRRAGQRAVPHLPGQRFGALRATSGTASRAASPTSTSAGGSTTAWASSGSPQVYDADLDVVRRERRIGSSAWPSYPFNKFTRIEARCWCAMPATTGSAATNSRTSTWCLTIFRWSTTTPRWSALGPSSGSRCDPSGGVTRDMNSGAGDFAPRSPRCATINGRFRYWSPRLASRLRRASARTHRCSISEDGPA